VYLSGNHILFWMGILTAVITAFYITRAVVLTFWHKPRSQAAAEAQESGPVMTVPLVILSLLSVGAGWLGAEFAGSLLPRFLGVEVHAADGVHQLVTLIASLAAVLGIGLALGFYHFRWFDPQKVVQRFGGLNRLLQQAYAFDPFYMKVFVQGTIRLSGRVSRFDRKVIDNFVNRVGSSTRSLAMGIAKLDQVLIDGFVVGMGHSLDRAGEQVRRWQSGQTASYLLSLVWAVLISILTFKIFG